MQRFCPNCGTALDDEMMFCPSCGSPTSQPQPQFAPQRANVYPQYSPAPTPAPTASSQPLGGAPGVSKVMVILYLVYLVTFEIVFILDAVAVAHFYDCWFRSGSKAAADFSRLSPVLMAVGCVLWIYGMQVRRLPFRSIWGLRLSSTLASEEAWKQAHSRLMLPLLLAGAFCLILGTFLP